MYEIHIGGEWGRSLHKHWKNSDLRAQELGKRPQRPVTGEPNTEKAAGKPAALDQALMSWAMPGPGSDVPIRSIS